MVPLHLKANLEVSFVQDYNITKITKTLEIGQEKTRINEESLEIETVQVAPEVASGLRIRQDSQEYFQTSTAPPKLSESQPPKSIQLVASVNVT